MAYRLKRFFFVVAILIVHWQTAAGQLFKLSNTFSGPDSPVSCMVLSSDGQFLVTGDKSGMLFFIDTGSGKIIRSEKTFNSPVDKINFNSTGRLMIVTTREGEIKIYDFVQEKFIHSLYSPEYTDMRFALFSIADGFIYFNGQGRLYKTRSDLSQPVQKIYESDSVITNAVITDDRSAFIFSCGNVIHVLNTRSDNVTQELVTSPSNIELLELSSGNRLASWSADGTIVLHQYELNQLNPELLLWFKAGSPGKLAFSRDGKMMVTGKIGNWARVWKPFEHQVMQELFGHTDEVTDFVFSKDDQTLFTTGKDKTIKVWKQKPGDKISKQPEETTAKTIVRVPEKVVDTVRQIVEVPHSTDSSMPAIELDRDNVPTQVGGRKVEKSSVVEVSDSTIDIYVFDNSTFDGDVMSLSFYNQWILTHYEVTKQKKKITLELKPGSNNYLVLFADNLGRTPPNTAAISFSQNGHERIFRLESDLKTCSAINFVYKGN